MTHFRIEDKLRSLEPVIGEQAKNLAALYAVSDPVERVELEGVIDALILKHLDKTHQKKTLLPAAVLDHHRHS